MIDRARLPKFLKVSGIPSFSTLYCSYLVLYSLVIVAGFATSLELPGVKEHIRNSVAALFLFDLFGVELSVICVVVLLLHSRSLILRTTAYLTSALFIFVQGVQLASFYQTKEFISGLAIENINHISFLVNPQTIAASLFLFLLCLLPVIAGERGSANKAVGKRLLPLTLLFVGAAVLLATSGRWLPDGVYKIRESYFQRNYLLHTSPLLALYETLFVRQAAGSSEFNAFEMQELEKQGFYLDPGKKYPLVKDRVFNGKPPFAAYDGGPEDPNIIIFFAEGLSERVLGFSQDALYPDLTPNIDDFADKSMVVNNYYSHTAATYRGILGQLCSLYPKYGGIVPEARYLSLADIFNKKSYDTVFFDCHDKDKAHVDELVKEIGFRQVFTAAPLADRYLEGEEPKGFEALSDNQLFKSLVGYLKEKENQSDGENPFFLCLYNLGTHAFKEITPDGKKYAKKDNQVLHTFHNFDHAFGSFWQYYQQSPYSKNTIIVFTSDHSHIAEKPFVKAFNQPGYQGLFVDKIPLIIHDPTRNLPEEFDGRNSTSIDFAPSLLHYLDYGDIVTPFMGTSMYSPRKPRVEKYGFAQHGKEAFLVDSRRVHRLRHTKEYKTILSLVNRYIRYSQELEVTGQLWSAELAATGAAR